MQDLALNVPTVILLLVILALAVLAVRRMTHKGLCDCGDHCDDGGCGGCHGCGAAEDMVKAMDKAAGESSCCCHEGEKH